MFEPATAMDEQAVVVCSHVLKSSGRTDGDVLAEIGAVAQRWVARLP